MCLPPTMPARCLSGRGPAVWLLAIVMASAPLAHAESNLRDLSDGEEALIIGASASVCLLGYFLPRSETAIESASEFRLNPLDRIMRNAIHPGDEWRSNFLDNRFGSVLTPTMAAIGVAAIDADRREFSRDIPMFLSGWAATAGLTRIGKSFVRRERPYRAAGAEFPPGLEPGDPDHRRSFFSGHSSTAFFAAAFFNKRFRRHMRSEWRRDEYETGRWLSPAISFGWAGIVALSRLHADRHYFTDVAVGAAVGAALAELYYHFSYETGGDATDNAGARRYVFKLSFAL